MNEAIRVGHYPAGLVCLFKCGNLDTDTHTEGRCMKTDGDHHQYPKDAWGCWLLGERSAIASPSPSQKEPTLPTPWLQTSDLQNWVNNKDLLCSTEYYALCYVAAWIGGEFGGEWIYVYVGWIPLLPHETINVVNWLSWEWKLLSPVWLFATPWTVAHQARLSMEFLRQEYWSGYLPFPSPGDLPDPRI